MDILNIIKNRRSMPSFTDASVDHTIIEEMLEAATWAPNHHMTEPWKFVVIEGDARDKLSDAMEVAAKEKVEDPSSKVGQTKINNIKNKPYLAPTIIAVILSPHETKKSVYIEDVCAVAAATQNMLLVAESRDIGTIWRSGDIYNYPSIKELLDVKDNEEVIGMVFVGEKGMDKKSERISYKNCTKWL